MAGRKRIIPSHTRGKEIRNEEGLTLKQDKFVNESLIDLNPTQAAELVGYSKKTAYLQGQRLLKNVEIQKAIQEKQKTSSEKLEISQERTLKELERIAFFDFRTLWNEKGNLIDFKKLDDNAGAAIAGADIEDIYDGAGKDRIYVGKLRKIRLVNKLNALEQLGKHLGLFEKDNRQKGEAVGEAFAALPSVERSARIVELVRLVKKRAAKAARRNGPKK